MTTEAYTGLMGSGKTMALVEKGLWGLAAGMEVYANFQIGRRAVGYLDPVTLDFVPMESLSHPAVRKGFMDAWPGVRIGRGFVRHPNLGVLRSWEHFCNLRVMRDPLGVAHKVGCAVAHCSGCSKGILILIDEVNSWANSRHWQEVGIGLLTKFTYMRKHGLELVVSAQHEDRLDVALRHLLEYTWLCTPGGLWTKDEQGISKRPVRLRGGFPLAWFYRERFIAGQLTDAVRAGTRVLDTHVGMLGGMLRERHHFSDSVADAYDTWEEVERPGTKKITELIWRNEQAS